jgi:hypothetical protein
MLSYDLEGDILGIWNAEIAATDRGHNYIRNAGNNSDILPGAFVQFSYQVADLAAHPSSIVMAQHRVARDSGYAVSVEITQDWGTGFIGTITITNQTDRPIEFWEMTFVSNNFTLQNSWERVLIDHGNNRRTIKPVAGNILRIAPNSTLTLGFQASKDTATGLADLDVVFESLTQMVFGEAADVVPPETDCRFGGRIASPSSANPNNFLNGNTPDGSFSSLNFDVLDLIAGTAIRANDVYGIAVVTWGPNTENRQVVIEVNGIASPMFHGSSTYNSARIWAVMEHGNTPNNGGRTEQNTLTYMNKYGGNPQIASNLVALTPFVNSANPANFDVRIRARNEHLSMVREVLLRTVQGLRQSTFRLVFS